jgi:hypothetical protein
LEVTPSVSAAAPSWLGYDFSVAQVEVSAKFFSQTTNFSAGSGCAFKIIKINTKSTDPVIHCGDQVVFLGYTNFGGANLAPLTFGIKSVTGLPMKANLFCFSSGANTYPEGFPNDNCWYIASVITGAFRSDGLESANPTVQPQNIATWPTQVPDLSAVAPATKPLIKYGDAIVLKHKNYGSYLKVSPSLISGGGTNWHTLCCASTKPTDNSAKFFIETVGESKSRFDSAGTQVRSGDMIRLEAVSLQGGVDTYNGTMYSNCGFWLYIEYNRFSPPVSNTRPPYQAVTLHYDVQVDTTAVDLGTAYRIYKQGANIGDVIGTDDDIYIVSWSYDNTTCHPIYLGSSNLSYKDGQEVYLYCDTTTGQPKQPPSFASNFLWTIAENNPAAYQSAVNVRWADFGFSLRGWPISGLYQW